MDDTAYGVTSYVDYPFGPFGSTGDFIYNTNQPVTQTVATAQAALNNLVSLSGGDLSEAQLVALQQAALWTVVEVANRPDAKHFIVLATDDPFHQAGDYPAGGQAGDYPAGGRNDNDTNLLDGTGTFGVEDYPKIAQIAEVLGNGDVTPIFLVTADELVTYQDLLNQLNALDPSIDGSVVQLSANTADLAAAIAADLKHGGHHGRGHHGRDYDADASSDDMVALAVTQQQQQPSTDLNLV